MKKFLVNLTTLTSLLAASLVPGPAAAADIDSILIDPITIETCNAASGSFSGTATYSDKTQSLSITVNGNEVLHSHREPATWRTGNINITTHGHNIIEGYIYDNPSHTEVLEYSFRKFYIPPCPDLNDHDAHEKDGGNDDNGDDGDDNDDNDEQTPTPAPQPRVKAATKKVSLIDRLRPLNSQFRSVFGRTPTYDEWVYWASRFDKSGAAFIGAMQWHNAHGRTTG